MLQRVLAQAPDSAYLKQQLVSEALVVDNTKLAQAYIDFIDHAQEDPEAWTIYGAYEWQMQHPRQALEAYEKALELDPDDERVLFQYIRLLAALEPQKAEKTLLDLAKSRPVLAPDLYQEIGEMYLFHRQYPKALDAFNQAVRLDPKNPQPRLGRANVYEKTSQYFLMLHELEELDQLGYATADTLSQMASVFILVKDLPRAKAYFERAKKLDNSNIPANYFLALFAEEEKDYPQALVLIQDAADYATSPTKQVQASFYLRKLGRTQEALNTLQQAQKQFPDDPEVAYFYALSLDEAKQYKKASRVLAPMVEKFPDREDLRLQYAFALEGQKKYDAMEEQVNIVLEKNPHNANALNLLAFSLAIRGERLAQAQEYIARALAQDPENPSYLDTQAWVYFKQGKHEQAADILRAIPEEVLQANPEIAYHASLIYGALEDRQTAVHYFRVACGNQAPKACYKELKKIR